MAGLTKNVKASLASDAVVAASKVKKWKYSDLDDYKVTARNTIINYYMQLYVYYMGSYPTSETDIISTFFTSNDAYQQTIADQAGMQLKTDWVLYQVAKDQELDTVSDEEYNKFITEQLASQNVGVSEEYQIDEATLVKNMGGKSVVKKYVILDKAQKWLGENITVV